jgi:multiple sugar transport system substrate-binding protein
MRAFLTIIILLHLAAGVCLDTARADGPVTLVFLTWKPNQPEGWDRLIEGFEKAYPHIRIKRQVGPHSSTDYHAIVTQRLRNRDPSLDVFLMDVIWPPEFAAAGWALELSSRFSVAEQQDFLTGPVRANTWQGRIYGVPCYIGAGLFYFRKDLLQKYGFDPPRTWEEMLGQGEVIRKGEGDPGLFVYSGQFKQYEGLVCDMLEFVWSNGGGVVDPSSGEVVLDRPAAVDAVRFVRDRIIGRAAPRGVLNYEEPESLDLFIQAKAVFHRNWPYAWGLANNPEPSRVAGRVGVTRLPSFEGHDSASTLGGWQFGINRYSRHPDAAWHFIRFMTSRKSQQTLALESGLAPARRSVYEDPLVREQMPHLKAFLPAFEKARPRPASPVYPMISQELQRFFSRAVAVDGSDIPGMAKASAGRIRRFVELGSTGLR